MDIVYSQSIDSLENSITVKFKDKDFVSKVDSKFRELAKTVKIDGFRKGKTPLSVIRQYYGQSVNQDIALDSSITTFYDAAKEKQIKLATRPSITNIDVKDNGQIIFIAKFEIIPNIESVDVSKYSIEKIECDITDVDVDQMVVNLRKKHRIWNDIGATREAKNGDRVFVSFAGKIDGNSFEGGASDGLHIELGSNSMIAGFEEGVLGMKVGEDRVIAVTFPDDYHAEKLRSQLANFVVNLKSLEEAVLPELNEEFIKKFGIETGIVDDLKKHLRKMMQFELEKSLKSRNKEKVFIEVSKNSDFLIPSSWIEDESRALAQSEKEKYKAQGMQQLDFMKPDVFVTVAKDKIRVSMVFENLIKEHNLIASESDIQEYIKDQKIADEKQSVEIEKYFEEEENYNNVKALITEQKVIDYVFLKANIKPVKEGFFQIFPQLS